MDLLDLNFRILGILNLKTVLFSPTSQKTIFLGHILSFSHLHHEMLRIKRCAVISSSRMPEKWLNGSQIYYPFLLYNIRKSEEEIRAAVPHILLLSLLKLQNITIELRDTLILQSIVLLVLFCYLSTCDASLLRQSLNIILQTTTTCVRW